MLSGGFLRRRVDGRRFGDQCDECGPALRVWRASDRQGWRIGSHAIDLLGVGGWVRERRVPSPLRWSATLRYE